MTRLIDADHVTEGKFHSMPMLQKYSARDIAYMYGWNDALDAVAEKAPTVEAVPKEQFDTWSKILDLDFEHSDNFWVETPNGKKVHFEKARPKGKWLYRIPEWNTIGYWYCRDCGEKVILTVGVSHAMNFCPNCGADMRGGEEGRRCEE